MLSSSSLVSPDRLGAVRASGLLDSPPDERFDRLTRLAARSIDAPVALLSVLDGDRHFLKSANGLSEPWASRREIPLSHSICKHVIASGAPLAIGDTRADPLLAGGPAVLEMEAISYLGHPIRARDGQIVGTICVIDRKRRQWREEDAAILADLASLAEAEIEAAQREPAALAPQAGLVADTVETDRIADLVERLTEGFYSLDTSWRITVANRIAAQL